METISNQELLELLATLGLGQYGPSFTEYNISGADLTYLGQASDLAALGITVTIHQRQLFTAVKVCSI